MGNYNGNFKWGFQIGVLYGDFVLGF